TRVFALGPSRIALGLAIVLVLVSLALPFWSLSEAMGTDQNISSFSWTTFTTDRYVGGAWDGTVILPYSSTVSPYRAVASVLGTAGAVFPYVKSVRAMIPSPPPGWRPSS